MSHSPATPWQAVTPLEGFPERLADGALTARRIVDELDPDLDVGGVVYHDRGIRVPAYGATFLREPASARSIPSFSVEADAVGPRSTWAVFDATLEWDLYLLRGADVAALAWVTDAEYATEDRRRFDSKREAMRAGRFSFGLFVLSEREWRERVAALAATDSPALLRQDDGTLVQPRDQTEFYETVGSSPEAFRRTGGRAPAYLGLLELEVSIADGESSAPGR